MIDVNLKEILIKKALKRRMLHCRDDDCVVQREDDDDDDDDDAR